MPTDYAIKNGRTVMDATLWTGDAVTPKTVYSNLQFQPDFVWAKTRSVATQHALYDSSRGAGSGRILNSDTTSPEGGTIGSTSDAQYGYLSAFNSNGISTVTGSSGINYFFNASGVTYVAWNWKSNGGTTASNTNGSITSTTQVNASAGFSIVTYTGTGSVATIGHGLGVAPAMMIIKARNATQGWLVYHQSIGNTGFIYLNDTAAAAYSINGWNNTSPTSTVFTTGVNGFTNASGQTQVAYCWAQVAGFSQFGSYTGNGSTDGPFVYTGFRPKFVMIKPSSATGEWIMWDTTRSPSNFVGVYLFANSSAAEGSSAEYLDLLSNGFKLRTTNTTLNNNGQTNIYMAFAENPFKYSNAR